MIKVWKLLEEQGETWVEGYANADGPRPVVAFKVPADKANRVVNFLNLVALDGDLVTRKFIAYHKVYDTLLKTHEREYFTGWRSSRALGRGQLTPGFTRIWQNAACYPTRGDARQIAMLIGATTGTYGVAEIIDGKLEDQECGS